MKCRDGQSTARVPHPLFMVSALVSQLMVGVKPSSFEARRLETLDRHNQRAIEKADACRDAVRDALAVVDDTSPLEWWSAQGRVRAMLHEALSALPVVVIMSIVVWAEATQGLDARRGRRRDDLAMIEEVFA